MHDVSYIPGFDENNGISGRPMNALTIDAEVGFNAGDEVQAEAQDGVDLTMLILAP
jgi:hypothetical protein